MPLFIEHPSSYERGAKVQIKVSLNGGNPQWAAAVACLGTAVTVGYVAYLNGVSEPTAIQLGLTTLPGGFLTQALACLPRSSGKRAKR
jgi:hypothetical protein